MVKAEKNLILEGKAKKPQSESTPEAAFGGSVRDRVPYPHSVLRICYLNLSSVLCYLHQHSALQNPPLGLSSVSVSVSVSVTASVTVIRSPNLYLLSVSVV